MEINEKCTKSLEVSELDNVNGSSMISYIDVIRKYVDKCEIFQKDIFVLKDYIR